MEQFLDEKILKAREMAQRQKNINIREESVYIDGQFYSFRAMPILENRVSIWVPDTFGVMPSRFVKQKYPMEERPQLVLTSQDTTINFAFNYLENQPISNEQILDATIGFQRLLKRIQPANHFYDLKSEYEKRQCYGWFDFKSPSIYQPIYTLMVFSPIGGKLFHGIFNCPAVKMQDWKSAFLQVVHTIEEITKKE